MFGKKRLGRMLGLVVLVALAVSCAPAPAVETPTAPPVATPAATAKPAAPTPTTPPEPVTLKLWKYASRMPNQALWVEEMIELYMEENPHVTIVYEEFPFATYGTEALPTAFAAGEAPDVFWATNSDVREFYEEGVLLPLDDYLSEEFKNDLLPEVLESRTKPDGHIYQIPFEMDITGICYRTDLWAEAGLTEDDIPETWDELIDVATGLTTEDRYGIYLDSSSSPFSVWQFSSWVWMGGGDFVDTELTTVLYDSQATVDALRLYDDLMNVHQAMVPTALGIAEALASGKAVMEFCTVAHLGTLDAAYPEVANLVTVFPLPVPEGGARADYYSVYGGYGLAVSNQGEHPEEAARLAAWLMAEDPSRPAKWVTWARIGTSPRASVIETPEYQALLEDPRVAAFVPLLETGHVELDAPMEIRQPVIDSMQAVLFGGVSPEEAARAAVAQMQAYIESR